MKKNNSFIGKKTFLAGIAATLLLGTFCVLQIKANSQKKIGIYGLNEQQTQALKSQIEKISEEKKLSLTVEVYDSTKPLSGQLNMTSRPVAVIAPSGHAVNTAVSKAENNTGFSQEIISEMTSSVKGAAVIENNKNNVIAVPLLCDYFQIDIENIAFKSSGMTGISTWDDIEQFLLIQKNQGRTPVIFAGDNGKTVLTMLGAFAEALDGEDSYKKAQKILTESSRKSFNAAKIASELCDNPDSPLATSIHYLGKWVKNGLINEKITTLTENDVKAYVKAHLNTAMFLTLSEHRAMDHNSISRYSTIYFPSERSADSRNFTASVIYAVQLKKSKELQTLIPELVSVQSQEELSRSTGLAPVLAHCRTPDKQSDDVRYWIAATDTPFAGLGNEVFLTENQSLQLGKELMSKILNAGRK